MERRVAARKARRLIGTGSLLLAGGLAVGYLPGCARGPRETVSYLWQSVPSAPWSKKATATDAESKGPTATANTGVSTEPQTETADAAKSADSQEPSRLSALWPLRSETPKLPDDPFLAAELAETQVDAEKPSSEPNAGTTVRNTFVAEFDSQLSRLRTALTNDVRRSDQPSEASQPRDEVRLRVESLMEQARDALSKDELATAMRTARSAQYISQSAQLIFAPNEERPVDLIRKIQDKMEAPPGADHTASDLAGQPTSEKPTLPEDAMSLEPVEWEISTAQAANAPRAIPLPNAEVEVEFGTVFSNRGVEARVVSVTGQPAESVVDQVVASTVAARKHLVPTTGTVKPTVEPSAPIEPQKPARAIRLPNWSDSTEDVESTDFAESGPDKLAVAESTPASAGLLFGVVIGLAGIIGLSLWRWSERRRFRA